MYSTISTCPEEALAEFYARYWKLCYRIAYHILKNHWDAEECVNDAFLLLWQQTPDNPLAYLSAATRNRAVSMVRRRCAAKRTADPGYIPPELHRADTDPETAVCTGLYLCDCFEKAFSRCSPSDREMFFRRYRAGETIRELAEAFSLTENCVKIRLMRMRNRLKEELEQG